MMTIEFNAFSFLRPKLKANGIDCPAGSFTVEKGTTVGELVSKCGLAKNDVESVFLNGKIVPWDRELHAGDRVALVPPGTPGPYRVLLGLK